MARTTSMTSSMRAAPSVSGGRPAPVGIGGLHDGGHGALAGQGLPDLLGDEGHQRVQQAQQLFEDGEEDGPGPAPWRAGSSP